MDPGNINRWPAAAEAEVIECAAQLDGGAWRVHMARVLRVVLVILTLVNFLGPCAAGMWLALRGYRIEAGIGLGFAVVVPFVWSLVALRPSMMIAGPLTLRGERAPPLLVIVVGFVAAGWQYCVLAAWTFGVFLFFEDRIGWGMPLPMLVWVYGTVMCPLSFMASKEADFGSAPVLALGFALTAFGTILAIYLARWPVITTVHWLAVLTVLAAAANSALAGRAAVKQRRAYAEKPPDAGGINSALYEALRH
ncbi:MAG: hypothetical protein ACYSUR_01905 [Planctomycetota bacterium]|jgi:hypothetical protein